MELAKSNNKVQKKTSSKDKNPFFSFGSNSDSATPFFQPKLQVNAPNDKYEQEADAVANQVMKAPSPIAETSSKTQPSIQAKPAITTAVNPAINTQRIQRAEQPEKNEERDMQPQTSAGINDKLMDTHPQTGMGIIQRQETNSQPANSIASVEQTVGSPGTPIDPGTRSFMEDRFGQDFGNVQIHNDSQAHQSSADINALAYTHQNHIAFGAGQYQPNTNDGKQLLAHELTHVVQQKAMSGISIQREATVTGGDIEVTSFLSASGKTSENINRIKEIITNVERILIVTGAQLVVYSAADSKVVGNYTINKVFLPSFYYISLTDGGFGIAALKESSEQQGGETVDKKQYNVYGKSNQPPSDADKEYLAYMNEQLTLSKWFTNDKDREAFYADLGNKVMVMAITPAGEMSSAKGGSGEESEVPPILPWMPAWQKGMQQLIKETRDKDTVSTDIPEIFKFYYSKSKVRWRALASATFEKNKAEVYLDISEKDNKAQKLSLIRDKIRIKQLTPEESVPQSKEAKDLAEELTWAYRLKKELDLKIGEERKKYPSSAELPDQTAITTSEEEVGKAFLKLSVYVIQTLHENVPTPETKAGSVLKTGILPQALAPGTPVEQLFEVVKQATRGLRGQEFKNNATNAPIAERLLEPFPASIGVAAGRPDFKTVTGAALDMHMNLNISVIEGNNLLHQTTIAYKGIYYTWDVYKLDNIITEDEKKTLDADWVKQRGQLLEMLKDSGRMKAVNPVVDEEKLKQWNAIQLGLQQPVIDAGKPLDPEQLKLLRNQELSYGSATKLTPDTTLKLPSVAGDYVVYCRALTEPDGTTMRLPSEAFYPIKVLDGYTLAEESRDANLREMDDLNKQAATTDDDKKKKKLTDRAAKIKRRETLSLSEKTAADNVEVERTKRLAERLIAFYQTTGGKKAGITDRIAAEPKADIDDLFEIWYTIETTSPQTPQVEKLQKMIKQLESQVKGLEALKKNIGDFSGDMASYKDGNYAPASSLVSKVTGEVYNVITMLGVRSDADGGTSVILVDVTSHQSQASYKGHSDKAKDAGGLEAAIQDAYDDFGKNCKYGEGYIAYRIPNVGISGHALSKPGFKAKALEYLGYLAMAAGVAALVLGSVATGGALGVAAFALGIGAGVIGAGLSIHNIYERNANHRFELDVETAMDILNIVGPIVIGLSSVTKVFKLSQVAKLGNLIKAGGVAGEAAETMGAIAKVNRLMQLEKAFAIIQKGEAIANVSLVGIKTFKDLSAIATAYPEGSKKRTAMEWEVIKNAMLTGGIALVAVRNEFKVNAGTVSELEQLVVSGSKERNYVELMVKSGLIDAEGKWIDPAVRMAEEGLTPPAEIATPADAPPAVKPIEPETTTPTAEPPVAPEPTVKSEPPAKSVDEPAPAKPDLAPEQASKPDKAVPTEKTSPDESAKERTPAKAPDEPTPTEKPATAEPAATPKAPEPEALKAPATGLEAELNEMIARIQESLKTSKGAQKRLDEFHLERFQQQKKRLVEHPDIAGIIKEELHEANRDWYPKDIAISPEAQGYLNQFRSKINQGSEVHIAKLLELSGSWKGLIKKLMAEPQANKATLTRLKLFRNNVIRRLKKKYEAYLLKGASTEPESDVDANIGGEDAGAKLIKAEAEMKAEFGDNWSDMLRLNFYTEGDRLLRYRSANLSGETLVAFEKELTRQSIRFNLAKMLQHTKGSPEGNKRVSRLMELIAPGQEADIQKLAATDDTTRLATRDKLHLEVDELQKELAAMDVNDSKRAAKMQEVSQKQMEINFHSVEAYIGGGSLMDGASMQGNTALKIQKVVSNLEMMEHILHMAGGDIVKAMKEYEMYKYMFRVSDGVNAAQTDLFYDYLTKQIYKVNREGAASMTNVQLENMYNDFSRMTNDFLAAEIKSVL